MPINDLVPFFGAELAWSSRTSKQTPEELERLKEEYRDAIGLSDSVTFNADGLDNAAKNLITDFSGLTTSKTPAGNNIHQKLSDKNNKDAPAVTALLNIALKPTDKFKRAQQDYNNSVAVFDKLKLLVPEEYKVQDLIDLMTEVEGTARKALVEELEHKKQSLIAELGPGKSLPGLLSVALELKNPGDGDDVKKALIAELDASQKKIVDEFDKSKNERLKGLHDASSAESNRLLFIANLYHNLTSEETRQEIRRLGIANAAKKRAAGLDPDNMVVEHGINESTSFLHGITLDDIPIIKSITGREIVLSDGAYVMKMDWRIKEPFYFLDPRQNVRHDAQLIANAVKASGFSKIKMTVDFKNNDLAMDHGRDAYEACIKAGFAPDKITVVVNKREMKLEDLYRGHEKALEYLHNESKELKAKYEKLGTAPQSSSGKLPDMKLRLNALKEEHQRNAGANINPNNENNPPAAPARNAP